jgi:hypothetical protein
MVTMEVVENLGRASDTRIREKHQREDSVLRLTAIKKCRDLIYQRGYVVKSKVVEDVLRATSLVPTLVSRYSSILTL